MSMAARTRGRAVTSAALVDLDHAVDVVLAFAAEPGDDDLAVAVTPERAAELAERIVGEAERRGVALEPDIELVECADARAVRALLDGGDRVLDSGCPYLRAASEPVPAPAPSPDRPRRAAIDLVLLNTYPATPPRNGGAVRIQGLWGGMPADVGASAVVLAPFDGPAASAPLTLARPRTERQIALWPELKELCRRLGEATGASADDLAAAAALGTNDPFGQALAETLAAGAAGIVLQHPFLVQQALAAAPELPIAYEAQNVEADLKRAMYRDDEGGRAAADAVARLERLACERARLVVCCTDDDRRRFHELYGVALDRIHVVPNGVAVADAIFTPWAVRAAAPPRCVFAGSAHAPNVEAATVVAEAAERLPHVAFDLVGDAGRELDGAALPANVVVHGRVSDAEKQRLFARASLALNPMRVGSGSNLKVADYVAAGLPVVTSDVGARGFGADLVACFQPCEPDGAPLAQAVRAALAADWGERTLEARRLVERDLDWRVLAGRYADLLHAAFAR